MHQPKAKRHFAAFAAEIKPQMVKDSEVLTVNIQYLDHKLLISHKKTSVSSHHILCHSWAFPCSLCSTERPNKWKCELDSIKPHRLPTGKTEPAAHFTVKTASPCIMQKLLPTESVDHMRNLKFFLRQPMFVLTDRKGEKTPFGINKPNIFLQSILEPI